MKTTILLLMMAVTVAVAENPLPNPGFEDGAKQWTIGDNMSRIVPEAAHSGQQGLRVTDEDTANGSSVMSARLPVTPGREVTLTFWARTKSSFSAVYLWFATADGKLIKDETRKAGGGLPACGVGKTDGEWHEYSMKATAPEGAAAVAVWVHSYSAATGTADFDDFALSGLADGVTPLPEVKKAAKPAAKVELPPRAKPPLIVLKLDDVKQIKGKVHPAWVRVAELVKARQIKASFGVVCETLAEAAPAYSQWIKDEQGSGRIEFWFHGWDHGTHTEAGKQYNEFTGRAYEEQKKRFDDSQKLALEKLGFAFQTFGPPGGVYGPSCDAATCRVMADDPHMKVWLYPKPIDADGKALEAAGKVVILDRVFEVNLESKVGVADYNKFVEGYAKHPDREYFVLQGHPMQWGQGGRFEEFAKIVDFLIAQKAEFLTPVECAARCRAKR